MLHVENLSKIFTIHGLEGRQIEGFFNVSFRLKPDGAIALKGPSGSGKSSILKCIYRTYSSTAGSILFTSKTLGEVDMAVASEQIVLRLRTKEIGYVSQFLKVLPRIHALDVVAEPLLNGSVGRKKARENAAALLERLHIPLALFDAYPVTFSGGEQQRINIARAIISKPRLLLLDEPTASLDHELMDVVIDLLLELRRQGTAIIMVFHDHNIIRSLADEIYEMPKRENIGMN